MAKAKKEAALTPEERLQAALVPDWEWPYKLPENWCWTKLGEISEIIMGQSPSGAETTDNSSYMPLVGGAADMGDMYPKATRFTKVPTKVSKRDDLILCIRATLGRPVFSDGEYCLGRGVAGIRPWYGCKEFYKYFFLNFEQYLYDNATGSTFAQVTGAILQNMPLPLPPLTEQQRIVDRIESLFAKLDEAKEKVQEVVDGYEARKAAILHKAFTGELTAVWREQHSIAVNYRDTSLGDVIEEFKYGTSLKSTYEYSDIPVLRIPNIGDETIDYEDVKFLPAECLPNVDLLSNGDILTIRSNGSRDLVGKSALIESINSPVTFASFLIRIRPCTKIILPEFLVKYLNSRDIRDQMFAKAKSSSGIHNINTKELSSLQIKVPEIKEQQEIVRILDDIFIKEQQIKEAAEAVLDQIDPMKKSILARAFRGELGTNDPNDEPAVELLKRII